MTTADGGPAGGGSGERRRVLCVLETSWDRRQLEQCRPSWEERLEVAFCAPSDAECRADFDALAFVERAARGEFGRIDGVFSSSDYPGAIVAAALAARLGLPGPRPERVIRAGHKWYSRLPQREAVPEAVPEHALLDPRAPGKPLALALPCFVKPVRASFSLLARQVDSQAELEAFLRSPAVQDFSAGYAAIYNRLQRALAPLEIDGSHFIAEGLLRGALVTVEGFACAGEVHILGVVDSIVHPGTRSFARFEYPSALPEPVQRRLEQLAARAVRELGLEQTLFNVEMMWDAARESAWIVEVNPRICGQFGDLYQKVDGTHGYEILLALCAGERPAPRRRAGAHAFAASVPLRVLEPSRVLRAPGPAELAAAQALYSGTLIWTETAAGEILDQFAAEDGASQRYAVINLGAPERSALTERARALEQCLGYAFAPA
jgi:biotin carboxylase